MGAMTLAKELQDMKAADVVRHETVRNQFINVYNSIWKEGGSCLLRPKLTRL